METLQVRGAGSREPITRTINSAHQHHPARLHHQDVPFRWRFRRASSNSHCFHRSNGSSTLDLETSCRTWPSAVESNHAPVNPISVGGSRPSHSANSPVRAFLRVPGGQQPFCYAPERPTMGEVRVARYSGATAEVAKWATSRSAP